MIHAQEPIAIEIVGEKNSMKTYYVSHRSMGLANGTSIENAWSFVQLLRMSRQIKVGDQIVVC